MFDRKIFDNDLLSPDSVNWEIFNMRWTALLVGAIVLALLVYRIFRKRYGLRSVVKLVEDNLAACAMGAWICGFILYCFTYWEDYDVGNFIVVIPRAAISAVSMFVSTTGFADAKSELRDSVLFVSMLSSVHLFAMFISAMVLLKVLGYKVESYVKMRLGRVTEKTMIFWGVNENSLMLAESIKDRQNTTVIFVDIPNGDESDNSNPLLGVLDGRSISRDDIFRMEKLGAYLLRAKCGFTDLNSTSESEKSKDIYSRMGIKLLRKYVRRVKLVNFYFLSDKEQENLDNLMSIVKFFGADQIDGLPLSRIYCHARSNSLNNIIDRISEKICFVDSSKLSVLQLQKDVRYQPASFVDIDTETAVVKSAFNALVVGFGETGRDAFQYLYEFSSFLGKEGELSERTINVVDAKLSEKKTRFLINSPALKDRDDIEWWMDMSIDKEAFWNKYRELIDKLNYVVITLNDDKLSSDLAIKLYEMAYR